MVSDAEGVGRAGQAGRLMLAAGLFTVANNYLPGAGQLDVAVLNLVGLTAVAVGLLAHVLPWHRWPGKATLVFPPVAFALIAVANRFGGVSDFSYGVYFVLAFTWVGLAFPVRTGFLLAPLATAAYVAPGLTTAHGRAGSVSSVTVVIPVCLLVAETIARTLQKVTAAAADVHHHETALREAEERFRLAFENAPIGMALVGLDGRWLRVNRAVCEIVGYPADELLTKTFQDITHPDDLELDLQHLGEMLAGEIKTYAIEKRYFHADGHVVWINLSVSLVRGEDDVPWHFISQIEDISARKAMEGELQRLALVDELTGLRNRRGFLAVADPLTRVAQRNLRDVVLVYIDVDNMKEINDHHGHGAGDRALVETADLLRGTFRQSDVIARLGGDEFCVLVADDGIETKVAIDRLEERLHARRTVGTDPVISLSLGIARYHWDEPCPVDVLIDRADAAMYEMKNERRAQAVTSDVPPGGTLRGAAKLPI